MFIGGLETALAIRGALFGVTGVLFIRAGCVYMLGIVPAKVMVLVSSLFERSGYSLSASWFGAPVWALNVS